MLVASNTDPVFTRLDEELSKLGEARTLMVCGGTALIVLKVSDRATRDVDVVEPKIDPALKEIATRVGREFGLEDNWLNDGPSSLATELVNGWRARTVSIFAGRSLELRSLGRGDLLATKLYAFCDREDDFSDVLDLKPSKEELAGLFSWVLARDASSLWPKRVEECFARIRKSFGYE